LNRPNFLVLGAAKAGTTSLCHYLAQHPDVFIPEVKEPIFFDAEYERGLDYYWKKYFSRWSGQPAVGEGRVFNLYLPFVPPRIRESIPDAKLIAVLRNPVERAYSHWWHRFSYRDEILPFHEAIRENLSRIARGILFEGGNGARLWRDGLVHPHAMATTHRVYLDAGLYARQIRRYLDLFPASQLKVMFYEDLVSDPRSLELPGGLERPGACRHRAAECGAHDPAKPAGVAARKGLRGPRPSWARSRATPGTPEVALS